MKEVSGDLTFTEHAAHPDVWEETTPAMRTEAEKAVRGCKNDIGFQAAMLCQVLRVAGDGGFPGLDDAATIQARLEAAIRIAKERGRTLTVHHFQRRRTVGIGTGGLVPACMGDDFILAEDAKGERIVLASSFCTHFDFNDRGGNRPAP